MAIRDPKRHQVRKVTLDVDRYLRGERGRWKLYQRVQIPNNPGGTYAWYPRPISPQLARQLMDQAGIERGEE